uniref:Transposase n=1 Tax=Acrobeloides nanus TaxID=290746 RepID=A0A914CYB1_9BILA
MKHDDLVFVKAFWIWWEGTVCLHFFELHETLEAERYIELLDVVILSACEEVYPDGNCVYQQDGAPAYRDKDTQSFLEERAPQFIRNYECSPDANPCDCRFWAWLKQKVYSKEMPENLEDLKARIREAWDELDTETIRKWLRELRPSREKWKANSAIFQQDL